MESVSPPEWLTRSKQALLKSQEWQEFQDQLTAAVDLHLTEVQLDNFRDLSEEAKRSLLQNALQSVHQGGSYARISARVSEIIAEHIHLNRKYHVDTMTTPEWASLQTQANAGLLHLLQKWPDLKSKLYRCFNIQLPQSLRRLVWSLYLENPQVKTKYLEKFRQNPESTMSLLDLEIVKNCDHLLQTEQTLQPLKTFSMTLQTSSSIIASDYMLALPFVYVTLATNPSTSLKVADTATTIEQFMTFMECRPVYMKESYTTEFEAVWTEFTDKVISRLGAADEDLLDM
ncbi:hypothetical protein BSL78_03039 [Apostichopus japonicus]|uniref:Uncharacterized protein n=1 Tax=Stichopus japonicus TaxID=307972 RepID=A0A2G8LII0_STIJA|nr:hypothetical protein BSL78_03039 [Apostichopus japonicus]